MSRRWRGNVVGAVVIGALLAVGACAPGLHGDQAGDSSGVAEASKPGLIKLEDGIDVEPIRVKWLEGEWRFIGTALAGLDESVVIERRETGEYLMTPAAPADAAKAPAPAESTRFGKETRLVVFKVDCHRFVYVRTTTAEGDSHALYGLLSGYGERLSIDTLPGLFPAAWHDKRVIAAVGASGDAVPVEKRLAALGTLVGWIDEMGTFMQQDLTFYRPSAFERAK